MQDENKQNKKSQTEETEASEQVEEFVPEDNEPHAGFGALKNDAIAKLKERIKKLETENREYLDLAQRTKADFVNLRKRDEDEKRELVKFATQNFIEELLPVLDSFEMAFANKEAWEKADKNWRTGVEYIHSQLISVLERNGVKRIDPTEQLFDPQRDTAVEHVSTDDPAKDGAITDVIQRGYELNGRLIRSPRVRVAEYKSVKQ